MGRTVEFLPDGQRALVSPQAVADAWSLRAPGIPAQYACGTAQHETNYTLNERDTEVSGFVSMGLYQIDSDEITAAGLDPSVCDPFSLEDVTQVFADVSQKRVAAMVKAASLTAPYPSDLWAYLSIAHNQGLGAALKTIQLRGLNWAAYQKRNLDAAVAALAQAHEHDDGSTDAAATVAAAETKLQWWRNVFAYGNDCISGGARWGEVRLH